MGVQENWLGGWVTKDGQEYTVFDGVRDRLSPYFDLVQTEDVELLMRLTDRTYYYMVTQVSVWRRR